MVSACVEQLPLALTTSIMTPGSVKEETSVTGILQFLYLLTYNVKVKHLVAKLSYGGIKHIRVTLIAGINTQHTQYFNYLNAEWIIYSLNGFVDSFLVLSREPHHLKKNVPSLRISVREKKIDEGLS